MSCVTGKGVHSWPRGPLGCRSGGPCQPTSIRFFPPMARNSRKRSKRQKGLLWASKYRFRGNGGPQRAPGCQIWSQLPPFGQTHDNHKVWPCIGPVLAQNAPFGGIGSLPSDQIWLFYCIAWYCMLLNCILLYCLPYIMVLHAISLYCMAGWHKAWLAG